jgi:uncharacterized protein
MTEARRPLRLIQRIPESRAITSVYLEAADGQPLWPFVAGQYLTVEVPRDDGHALKTYTISSAASDLNRYRLTIKHEKAPSPDLPDGVGSTYLLHGLPVGGTLQALAPRGKFTLPETAQSLVLLSGGVGLTPMVSMLAQEAARGPARDIHFLHACLDGSVQALDSEIRALAARQGRTRVHVFHETPLPGAALGQDYDFAGRIDMDALRRVLPFDDHLFYLCGPGGFMAALYDGLTSLNVDPSRIAYEFFGPATVLRPKTARPSTEPAAALSGEGPLVTFQRSGRTAVFPEGQDSLLHLAQSIGLDPLYSCGEGVCGTCQCSLVSGEVDYATDPIAYLEPGQILTCITRPRGPVTIDL